MENLTNKKSNFAKYFLILVVIHLIVFVPLFISAPEQVLGKSKNYYLFVNILIIIVLFFFGYLGGIMNFWMRLYRGIGINVPPKKNPASKLFWGEELTNDNYQVFYPKMFKSFDLIFLIFFILIINLMFLLKSFPTYIFGILILAILILLVPLCRFFFKRV